MKPKRAKPSPALDSARQRPDYMPNGFAENAVLEFSLHRIHPIALTVYY
jgi:hypothetical protein